jgi:hypothetical protein
VVEFDRIEEWAGDPGAVKARIEGTTHCRALFAIWTEARGGRPVMPMKSDIDSMLLAGAGVMPLLWLIERGPDGQYFYRLTGEKVRSNFALPIKGRYLSEVFTDPLLSFLHARYDRALNTPAVEYSSGDVLYLDTPVYYARRLMVPLADAEGRPRYVLATLDRTDHDTSYDEAATPHYTYDFLGVLPASHW